MPRTNLLIGALFSGSVILSGCAAVPYAAVGAASVITDANRSSYADVSVTLTPGYELDSIKRVRFETGSDETEGITMMTRDDGITQTLVDNLIREFLVAGYDVLEDESEVDGVFNVSAQLDSSYSMGFMGVGANLKNGVTGVTLRLVDPASSRTVAVISADYKKAQSPKDVATQIAGAFGEAIASNEGEAS